MSPDIYPASLIEFAEKYPEATDFVLAYPKKKDKNPKIDISGEVKKGEIPLFIQWDDRWGYRTYGGDFFAVTGCGPTCLSMIQCGLSGKAKWNPYQVAQMADKQGFYVKGVGSSWDLMKTGAQKLGLEVHEVADNAAQIQETLLAGMPIICSVEPGDFTYTGHFIVLANINNDGTIKVLDPNSKINSEKSWELDRLIPQIAGLWAYSYSGN